MQLEQLESEVEQIAHNSQPVSSKGEKLRNVWNVAREVLIMLSHSFFIPRKFRSIITVVVEGVDELLKPETEAINNADQPDQGHDLPGKGGW